MNKKGRRKSTLRQIRKFEYRICSKLEVLNFKYAVSRTHIAKKYEMFEKEKIESVPSQKAYLTKSRYSFNISYVTTGTATSSRSSEGVIAGEGIGAKIF